MSRPMATHCEYPVSMASSAPATRAGVFVDKHVGLWVAVQGEETLALAGNDPADVFAAAADWLREGPPYTVQDVSWERRDTEPAYALRLILCHPAEEADHLAVLQQA
jgi:hypothetical protein